MIYALAPTNSDIMHFGVSAKDGAPGRGSGRYPLGSGKDGKKISKKQIKREAGEHINTLRNQELNEKTKSEQTWDTVMDEIIKSKYDSKTEKFWLDTAIDASLDNHLKIGVKYDDMIKKYLIDTGLANEKMSNVKVMKIGNKLQDKYVKSEKKRLSNYA